MKLPLTSEVTKGEPEMKPRKKKKKKKYGENYQNQNQVIKIINIYIYKLIISLLPDEAGKNK